ncbi:zinc finger protein 862-like [Amphiura filiformis]|uniref:zinc finger protein 862-like n=1 Tax=Amphiura filiformis TaxID=82378 RepID=UPI003B214E35
MPQGKKQQQTLFTLWTGGKSKKTGSEEKGHDDAETADKSDKLISEDISVPGESDHGDSQSGAGTDREPETSERAEGENTGEANAASVDRPSASSSTKKAASTSGSSSGKPPGKTKTYHFQTVWRMGNSWLEYDAAAKKMYCTVCQKFDKTGKRNAFKDEGCGSFRYSVVNAHKESAAHEAAMGAFESSKLPTEEKPLHKAAIKINNKEMEKLKIFFTSSFYIAQFNKPYRDFDNLIGLQVHNFARNEEHKYKTYRTDKKCKEFIDSIAAEIVENTVTNKLNSNSFISILADGSTDLGNTEQEIVYITMLQDGKPVTQYVTMTSVRSANAENLAKALKNTLQDKLKLGDNWPNNVMACCFDGAAVMMGHVSGVATNLMKDAPHLIRIHCCAHRLELAIKDTLKLDEIEAIDDVLNHAYRHYKLSRVNWEGLQDTGTALKKTVKRPVRVNGTRWLAHHHRAAEAVDNNWSCMVVNLEHQMQTEKAERREKAETLLNKLRAIEFVLMFNFFLCYLAIMKGMSLVLQKNNVTVDQVVDTISSVSTRLKQLKEKNLENVLMKDVVVTEEDGLSFRGEIIGRSTSNRETRSDKENKAEEIKRKVMETAKKIVDGTIQNIDERFGSLVDNDIIKAAAIANVHNWPSEAQALNEYGEDEVEKLYMHFEGPLKRQNIDLNQAKVQWIELKTRVARKRKLEKTAAANAQAQQKKQKSTKPKSSSMQIWEDILTDPQLKDHFKHILTIIEIILILPVHTSNLERGFSQMNLIKTEKRTHLTTESLNSLLTVKLSGLDYGSYDPVGAIIRWWKHSDSHSQTVPVKRRPTVQPYGPRKKLKESEGLHVTGPLTSETSVTTINDIDEEEPEDKSESEQDSDYDIPAAASSSSDKAKGVAALAKSYELDSDSDSDIGWESEEDVISDSESEASELDN